ncbi:hypothetical protein Q2941_30505 [Bradyrhizobium sp. UFLA05-153]
MTYCDQDLLDALRQTGSAGERYNRAIVVFHGLFSQHGGRVLAHIKGRARAARLKPDKVLGETIKNSLQYLAEQAEEAAKKEAAEKEAAEKKPSDKESSEKTKSSEKESSEKKYFEFTVKPGFAKWLLVICGSHKYPGNGGVIPTLLSERRKANTREQLVWEHEDLPDESSYDEAAPTALLQSNDLDKLFAGVDSVDRCLFEFNKTGLSGPPSANTVVAHISRFGLTRTSLDRLCHRAQLMGWPKRKRPYLITQEELAVLFELPKEDVTDRIRTTMQHLRNRIDRSDVSPYPHWSVACGRRKSAAQIEY